MGIMKIIKIGISVLIVLFLTIGVCDYAIGQGTAGDYLNQGNTSYKKGLYNQAISDYNKAIEIDPKYAGAYNNRGYTYYSKDLYDQAISDYNKAIEIDPRYAGAYNNR